MCHHPFPSGQAPLSKELSNKSQHDFILDELKTWSLVSIDQLCDNDCILILPSSMSRYLRITKSIITGMCKNHGLHNILIKLLTCPPPKIQRNRIKSLANGVIYLQQTKKETARYLLGCCLNSIPSIILHTSIKLSFFVAIISINVLRFSCLLFWEKLYMVCICSNYCCLH